MQQEPGCEKFAVSSFTLFYANYFITLVDILSVPSSHII